MKIPLWKIALITILIALCWHGSTFAQTTIFIAHVDALKITKGKGQVSFYQKQAQQYRKLDVDLYEKGDDRFKPSGKWQTYEEIVGPGDELIWIDSLKSHDPKSLLKYLSKYQFLTSDVDKSSTTYYALQLFSPYTALVREMDTPNMQYLPDTLGDWPRYGFGVASFIILQFRTDKSILLYQDEGGYFIPAQRKDYIYVKDYPFDTVQVLRQKADNRWKGNYEIIEQITGCYSYIYNNNRFYVDNTDDDKQILTDAYGNRLLDDSYDSIASLKYFIITSKGGKMEVYNLFLKPLFKNVRSYTLNNNYPQLVNLLIDNKVFSADFEGTINPTKTYPQAYYYTPKMHPSQYDNKDAVRVEKDKNTYYCISYFYEANGTEPVRQRNDIILPENVKPEDATFYEYLLDDSPYKSGGWFMVKKNNAYGLYFLRYPDEDSKLSKADKRSWRTDTIVAAMPVACKELLPIAFDSITVFNRHDRRKLSIYKNGLMGLYPLQTEAKYLFIDKPDDKQFSRFELPDGRKGWFNFQSNKAFFDL